MCQKNAGGMTNNVAHDKNAVRTESTLVKHSGRADVLPPALASATVKDLHLSF